MVVYDLYSQDRELRVSLADFLAACRADRLLLHALGGALPEETRRKAFLLLVTGDLRHANLGVGGSGSELLDKGAGGDGECN